MVSKADQAELMIKTGFLVTPVEIAILKSMHGGCKKFDAYPNGLMTPLLSKTSSYSYRFICIGCYLPANVNSLIKSVHAAAHATQLCTGLTSTCCILQLSAAAFYATPGHAQCALTTVTNLW